MGKEIKISLAVIAVLLGAMGYALYRQFAPAIGDRSTEESVAEETQSPGSESSTETEQGLPAAESTRPTFVAATSGVDDDAGTASQSTDPWAAVSSSPGSHGPESARSGSSRFSYMPQAVPAAPAGRYAAGYGSESSSAATSESWSTDQGTAGTQPGYNSYRTYGSQSTTPTYSSSATPSAGGGSTYQSPSASAGVSHQNPAAGQTGYQGYQNSAPPAGSASGTSGTSATGNWPSSSGYSGTSDFQGSYNRQDSLPDQYGSGTSGASTQSSSSYGGNQGSQYGTSGSYGPSSFSTTAPTTSTENAYSAGSTSTSTYGAESPSHYGSNAGSTYGSNAGSTYGSNSTSNYGLNATATTTGQSSAAYSNSARQDGFGQGSFGQSSFAQKAVIDTKPQEGKYLVQPNDSFWTISQRLYGTGAYFRALAEHNRSKNRDTHQLRVGDEIDAPSASTLEASYPHLCPEPSHREAIQHRASVAGTVPQPSGSNVYTVQAGDTLFDIARYELGKASRWVEIYQLNRERLGKNFDYLTPGLKLAMPADASSETVTQQPGVSFRR